MSKRMYYKSEVIKGRNRVDYKSHGSGHASNPIDERQLVRDTLLESSEKTAELIGGNPSRDYHRAKNLELEKLLDNL